MNKSMEEPATKKDLAELKRELLAKLATKEELKKLATKDELKKLATKDELKKLATKEELKKFATKEDLKKLATKEDLKRFVTIEVHQKSENKLYSEIIRLEEKLNLFETKADATKKFNIIMKALDKISARIDSYYIEKAAMDHALQRHELRIDDHEQRIQRLESG